MALKTVVVDAFFDKVIHAIDAYQQTHGELALAMLNSRAGQDPKWDLTLAAPWIDEQSIRKTGADAAAFFHTQLGSAARELRYVRLRWMNDPMIGTILPALDVPTLGTPYEVRAMELDVFHLDEVVVLLANIAVASQSLQRLSA